VDDDDDDDDDDDGDIICKCRSCGSWSGWNKDASLLSVW